MPQTDKLYLLPTSQTTSRKFLLCVYASVASWCNLLLLFFMIVILIMQFHGWTVFLAVSVKRLHFKNTPRICSIYCRQNYVVFCIILAKVFVILCCTVIKWSCLAKVQIIYYFSSNSHLNTDSWNNKATFQCNTVAKVQCIIVEQRAVKYSTVQLSAVRCSRVE